jgi:23S rRNA pseudouridine2604 synthase
MSETVRLAKRVAELFHCSRGEAIQYIEGGWITVNGTIVEESGFRVAPQERIELLPEASLAPVEPVTILLHKPSGISTDIATELIVPDNQAADDRSGIRFLKRHLTGLTMVDSLETDASGLLVFTQDWRVKRKLVDDAAKIEHEYIVDVSGDMAPDGLALLNQAQTFNGKPIPPFKASWQSEMRLRFAMKAASSRLIKHLCEKVGLTVVSMKRIRMGRVPMAGLAAGQWRYLMGYERF